MKPPNQAHICASQPFRGSWQTDCFHWPKYYPQSLLFGSKLRKCRQDYIVFVVHHLRIRTLTVQPSSDFFATLLILIVSISLLHTRAGACIFECFSVWLAVAGIGLVSHWLLSYLLHPSFSTLTKVIDIANAHTQEMTTVRSLVSQLCFVFQLSDSFWQLIIFTHRVTI